MILHVIWCALYVVGIRQPYPKWVPQLLWVWQSSGFERETCLWVRAAQSKQSEGWSDTKDHQHFGAPSAPLRGPNIIKLHIWVQTRRFPSRPYVGWHLAIRIFYADYLGKKRETTLSRFDQGGGGISPCLILWRARALASSHPRKVT
jgi:hypothetical protein